MVVVMLPIQQLAESIVFSSIERFTYDDNGAGVTTVVKMRREYYTLHITHYIQFSDNEGKCNVIKEMFFLGLAEFIIIRRPLVRLFSINYFPL